jgi:formate dehydrogenase accessory protein FdhD
MNLHDLPEGVSADLAHLFEPLAKAQATALDGTATSEQVAQETPVAIVVNGISHAVMMCTPHDLEDFALGFGLSEGLLKSPTELLDVEMEAAPEGISLQLRVTLACERRFKARRRTLAGRTGCGLCGIESLTEMRREIAPVAPALLTPDVDTALAQAMQALNAAQTLNAQCGGLHAAAVFNEAGHLLLAREDVGRHNALDKLVGALARHNDGAAEDERIRPEASFVAISSRASYEMVQKTASAGFGLLASVSAPTALAIATAQSCGLALYGFVREGRATRYA